MPIIEGFKGLEVAHCDQSNEVLIEDIRSFGGCSQPIRQCQGHEAGLSRYT